MLPGSCKFKLTKIKQSDATHKERQLGFTTPDINPASCGGIFCTHEFIAAAPWPWQRVPQPISVEHWVALPCSQKLLPLNCLRQRGAPL
mmetsp:Transcript_22550/g.41132  ORF Transcript_22550/g.41132 Transcript_22550/m.41132 type:complete len:89 (-) Transcript_22550:1656-1922(-)